MAHFFLLGFEVEFVFSGGRDFDGDALGDGDAVLADVVDFLRVVCQEADVGCAEISENLCAGHVLAKVGSEAELEIRFDGVIAFVLQGIGADLIDEADAAAFLTQVDEDAPTFFGDLAHGCGELLAAVAAERSEAVAGEAFGVNAAEDGRSVIDLPHSEGDVVLAIHAIHEAVDLKVAVLGRKFRSGDAFDEYLMLFPVFDELLNVADLEAFFLRKAEEVFAAGHGAVFIHDLAAQAGGLEPRKAGEVDGCFGMALPFKDAPAAGFQREKMPRAAELFRLRTVFDGFQGCHGAGGSRDAGARVLVVNGLEEGSLVIVRIVTDHRSEVQGFCDFLGHRHADDALRFGCHAVHILRRSEFCGADVVAFVFAGLCVLHDDDVSLPDFF